MTSRRALLFECPKCYKLVVAFPPGILNCNGIISRSPTFSTEHETATMEFISIVPTVIAQENLDYGMLANDISEAIEKTIDDHGLSFGDRVIVRALPQFIATLIAEQEELDREEKIDNG